MKRTLSKNLILGACLGLAFAALGCSGEHFHMHVAKDFVVLEESYPFDFRATTPDGLVIGVREFENTDTRGELEFWVKAIENKLRLDDGYALLEKKAVTTKQGLVGQQLRFGHDRDDEAHTYVVSVFVTERQTLRGKKSRVYVVEAGGKESLMKRHQAQIDWSTAEFVAK